MSTMIGVLIVLCALTIAVSSGDSTYVNTTLGTIKGRINAFTTQGADFTVKTFLGIPYAKPPTGDRRFMKTELLTQMQDPLNATIFGSACMQTRALINHREFNSMSEDCLFLNIYVPNTTPVEASGFAVMVYLHGGGFTNNAGENYRGEVLSALNDVIVVTVNYRLGIFGFLSLGVTDGKGNLGLWDQHIALQWINKHIGSFNGDNRRVTLFGASAGGQSIIYHSLFAGNRGLFQRFISESGNIPVFPNSYLNFKSNAKSQLEFLSKNLNCNRKLLYDTVLCLQSLSAESILEKLQNLATDVFNQRDLLFAPTIDGDMIKTDPSSLRTIPNQHNLEDTNFFRSLDMLTGFNNEEGALFALLLLPNVEHFRPSKEELQNVYVPMGLTFASLEITPATAKIIGYEYTDWTNDEVSAVRKQLLNFYTEIMFAVGTLAYAQLHDVTTATGSRFLYRFNASPTNHLLPTPSWAQGANHGDEIPFVFGFSPGMETIVSGNFTDPKDWEFTLSNTIMKFWTNFAKSGNPNKPVPVSPVWPQYDNNNQRYIELEQNMTAASARQYLLSDKMNFWFNVYPEVLRTTRDNGGKCGA